MTPPPDAVEAWWLALSGDLRGRQERAELLLNAFDAARKAGRIHALVTYRCDATTGRDGSCMLARLWRTPNGYWLELGKGKFSPGKAAALGYSRRDSPRRVVEVDELVTFGSLASLTCRHRHLFADVLEMVADAELKPEQPLMLPDDSGRVCREIIA